MTDLVIVPANVVAGTNATFEQGLAGATVLAGQTVYQDSTTKKYVLSDNNLAAIEGRTPRGIALHGASLNQPLRILKSGDITIGATITAGVAYYQSANPGGICPAADVVSGSQATIVGMGKTTTVLTVDIQTTGVQL
jgi:hypothetical protein